MRGAKTGRLAATAAAIPTTHAPGARRAAWGLGRSGSRTLVSSMPTMIKTTATIAAPIRRLGGATYRKVAHCQWVMLPRVGCFGTMAPTDATCGTVSPAGPPRRPYANAFLQGGGVEGRR
jgi:hypothetical protein